MIKKILIGLGITIVVSGLGFIILDITLGESMSLECSVTGKYYKPERTTLTTDAEGKVHIDTDPEEFHITVVEINPDYNSHDISTTRHWYSNITNGQIVRVSASLGKWTQHVYTGGITE